MPHFNRDTVEIASREKDESKPEINTLLPLLKNITEESDLENSQDLVLASDACYWLYKVISISLSRFRDDHWQFQAAISCFLEDFLKVLFSAVLICIFLSQSERDL